LTANAILLMIRKKKEKNEKSIKTFDIKTAYDS